MPTNSNESKTPLDSQAALKVAQADLAAWQDAQTWTLEDHIVKKAGEIFQQSRREELDQKLKQLGDYTVEKLTVLGNEYGLLADYNLEKESLKIYCDRNRIELLL